ncbi:MAG TPA: protein kinase [Thermoanaerobaculia bacterium]|nr:protein kinase [Thermoanaerobaculia bacterium]
MTAASETTGETRASVRPIDRAKNPLSLQLFLVMTLLILVVIGVALGITLRRSEAIANEAVTQAIGAAASLFDDLEQSRLRQLTLGAETIGRDVPFVAYVERALASGSTDDPAVSEPARTFVDVASILDLLQERRAILESDLLIVTDDQGYLLARTDQTTVAGGAQADLYEKQPLLRAAIDEGEVQSGVMMTGGQLYHAAVAPLSVGAGGVVTGYLINAFLIDERFANRIAETTRASVIFLPEPDPEERIQPSRSTAAPNPALFSSMEEIRSVWTAGAKVAPKQIALARDRWVMTAKPLRAGEEAVGASIFVRSFDEEVEPFRAIERTLLYAGAGAVVLAFILSAFLARGLTRPISRLATMTEAVAGGDYSVRPETSRKDEIGVLSRSFAQMISALRDKSELEHLYQEMSARAAGSDRAAPPRQPRREEGTILVTDLRGFSSTTEEASGVLAELSEAIRVQEREIVRQEGTVIDVDGHRLMSLFSGDRGVVRAIRAARAISEELATWKSGESPLSIGSGISSGSFVSGELDLEAESGIAVVGSAPMLALVFAWGAPSGHAWISLDAAQAAGEEITASGTRDELRLRWLAAPIPVHSVPLRALGTGFMRSITPTAGGGATMRLDGLPAVGEIDVREGELFAGRYRVEEVIGRGGMGIVYKARDEQLDEVVAIKVLPGSAMAQSAEQVERFKREIRMARKITHRNVLRTFDWGQSDGVYFISMEYVRGYTLAQYLENTSQPPPRVALGVARQICRGLQTAHEQGIIHRDIKPQNVLIDQRGEVKLMDFGIARMAEAGGGMTQQGLIVGTPHYMSPEQVQGATLDARSDVYAMGVLLFELLTGRKPFDAPVLTGVLTAHLTQPAPRPSSVRPGIDGRLDAIVLRCLEKDAAKRYADAGALLADLERVQLTAAA